MLRSLTKVIDVLTAQEDLKWKQRTKKNWHSMGDRNTKYFHACATQWQWRNTISYVLNHNDQPMTDPIELAQVFCTYFQNMFQSSNLSQHNINQCVHWVVQCVSSTMNGKFLKQYTSEEVMVALYSMASFKFLRLDGFNACFY